MKNYYDKIKIYIPTGNEIPSNEIFLQSSQLNLFHNYLAREQAD